MAGNGQTLTASAATSLVPTAAVTRLSDFNRDGFTDLVARDTKGLLWLYPGNGAGGLSTRRQIGSGWQNFYFTSAANLNGVGRPDIFAAGSSTTSRRLLWLYPLSGNAVFGPRTQVAHGLGEATVLGPGDVSGDGRADMMTVDTSNRTLLYRGNGMGRVAAGTPVAIAWGDLKALVTPGNWDRKAGNDLIAQDDLGRLWLHPGNNAGGFCPRRQIGQGWNGMTSIG